MDAERSIDAAAQAAASGDFLSIVPYAATPHGGAVNEFLLFFKPELTLPPDRLRRVWDVVRDAMHRFDCRPTAAVACGARYLRRHRIFEQHYGVINQVSSRGVEAVTETGRRKIDELIQQEGGDVEVLGGHQFLERFPNYTAESLADLHDSLPLHRFAGGTYGVIAGVAGRSVLLLNGFHPYQLEEYYTDGRSILNLVLRSSVTWKALRREFCGATNPSRADPDSIRGQLLRRKDELGLVEVSPAHNGVHVSAGPIEAMVEISRFMNNQDTDGVVPPEATTLGNELVRASGRELVATLCSNVNVRFGSASESVFDLTEEWDSWTLLQAVEQHALQPVVG